MVGMIHTTTLDKGSLRLKVASKALVAAVHGTEMAGEIAGMRQQRVSECTLPNTPAFLSIDAVAALEEAAAGSPGWPQVTRALARRHGFELLPLPLAAPGKSDWHRSLGEVSREVGDAVGKICAALSDDGEVSAREIREAGIVEEIDEAIARLAELKGLATAKLAEGEIQITYRTRAEERG